MHLVLLLYRFSNIVWYGNQHEVIFTCLFGLLSRCSSTQKRCGKHVILLILTSKFLNSLLANIAKSNNQTIASEDKYHCVDCGSNQIPSIQCQPASGTNRCRMAAKAKSGTIHLSEVKCLQLCSKVAMMMSAQVGITLSPYVSLLLKQLQLVKFWILNYYGETANAFSITYALTWLII